MSLATIRAGLLANLSGLEGQKSAYRLANPTPPTIMVIGPTSEPGVEYHRSMQNGHDEWQITVMALVPFTADIGHQKLLDGYLSSTGTNSVKAAIETDKTLGGAAQDSSVTSMSPIRIYQYDQRQYLGAEWSIRILATGT